MNKHEFRIQRSAYRLAMRELRKKTKPGSKARDIMHNEIMSEFCHQVRFTVIDRNQTIFFKVVECYHDRRWYKHNMSQFPLPHLKGVKLNKENEYIFNLFAMRNAIS